MRRRRNSKTIECIVFFVNASFESKNKEKRIIDRINNCKKNEKIYVTYEETCELSKIFDGIFVMKNEMKKFVEINNEYQEKIKFLEYENKVVKDDNQFLLDKNKKLMNRISDQNEESEKKRQEIELDYVNSTKMFQEKVMILNKK